MRFRLIIVVGLATIILGCGSRINSGSLVNSQKMNTEEPVVGPGSDATKNLKISKAEASRSAEFSIELENASNRPLRLWKQSNSWGAACWRIILIRDGRLEVFYQNPDQGFTKNGPGYTEMAAGTRLKIGLSPNGGNWCGFDHCSIYNEHGLGGKLLAFEPNDTVIVIYDVPVTQEARDNGVWYGVIAATSNVQ